MRRLLAIALVLLTLTGCATIRKHPYASGMIGFAAVAGTGIAVGILTKHNCPHTISGYPYDGTYPCPKSCDGPGDCYWPK